MGRSNNHSKGGGGFKGKGGGKKGGGHHKGKPTNNKNSNFPQRHKKVEITFNPTDRHEYLTGFSTRKKERRAFGLAMQKVKDRQAKLEERKEQREAQLEKIEDIERNKVALRRGMAGDSNNNNDDDDDDDGSVSCNEPQHSSDHNQQQELKTFKDEQTTQQFGGLVSVTTTFGIPDDDDDDDDSINDKRDFYERKTHGAGHVDTAQKKAGDVHSYIASVKGTMGNKKKSSNQGHKQKKGQHGASTMKGMGNASNLKMAKKTLAKFKAKGGGMDERGAGGKGGKGRKRKGRR